MLSPQRMTDSSIQPSTHLPGRLWRPIFVMTAVLLVVVVISIFIGAADVSWRSVVAGDETARAVLLRIRLPRVIVAALIGATLAVSGLAFQTLLRNPLADPFILGVSGGAACGAAISTALGLARVPGLVPIVAFASACSATAAVFLLARRHGRTDTTRLLLSGLVLNAFFSAIILIAFSLAPQSDLAAALRWMMGTLAGATWGDAVLLAVLLTMAVIVLVVTGNDLRMLAFGEDDARARGVDVERLKLIGFAIASVVTGAAVSVSGIIGFVGLLVPHLVRLIWRRDFRFLLPLCVLCGAALLVLSDLVSRIAIAPAELPVGAFTALLGVPFFISLLRSER